MLGSARQTRYTASVRKIWLPVVSNTESDLPVWEVNPRRSVLETNSLPIRQLVGYVLTIANRNLTTGALIVASFDSPPFKNILKFHNVQTLMFCGVTGVRGSLSWVDSWDWWRTSSLPAGDSLLDRHQALNSCQYVLYNVYSLHKLHKTASIALRFWQKN